MDLVVDANVLFAALIKESATDLMLFADYLHLYTPEYIFTEFEKYKEEILQKTKRSTEDFYKLIEALKRRIILVPFEELDPYLQRAEIISPDPKDVAYFALALKLHCAIWSNDKKLKEKQDKVQVFHTHELINM